MPEGAVDDGGRQRDEHEDAQLFSHVYASPTRAPVNDSRPAGPDS